MVETSFRRWLQRRRKALDLTQEELAQRVGKPPEFIRAARDIQTKRFSGNGFSDIVCNDDMRVGEIRHQSPTFSLISLIVGMTGILAIAIIQALYLPRLIQTAQQGALSSTALFFIG